MMLLIAFFRGTDGALRHWMQLTGSLASETSFSSRPRRHTTTITIPIRYLTTIVGVPLGDVGCVDRSERASCFCEAECRRTVHCRSDNRFACTHSQLAYA